MNNNVTYENTIKLLEKISAGIDELDTLLESLKDLKISIDAEERLRGTLRHFLMRLIKMYYFEKITPEKLKEFQELLDHLIDHNKEIV